MNDHNCGTATPPTTLQEKAANVRWMIPPESLFLASDEVHLWRLTLEERTDRCQCLLQTLSSDEVRKAKSYHFQRDREHSIVARGMTRAILGEYLNVNPAELRFDYNRFGKPSLADHFRANGLRFNLSPFLRFGP